MWLDLTVELNGFPWGNFDATIFVQDCLSFLDFFGSCLLSPKLIEEEACNKSQQKKEDKTDANYDDQNCCTIFSLDECDLLIVNLNDLSLFEPVNMLNDFLTINCLLLVDNFLAILLHDWDVWNEDSTLYLRRLSCI
jgi:hypothetical protein